MALPQGLCGRALLRRLRRRLPLCLRLVLAAAFWSKPHLIALDEPTNYLDNDTVAALTLALKNFKGAVVTISHNENFIAEISNEKWIVENGKIACVMLRDAKAR